MIEVIQMKQAVLAQKLRKARKELGLTQKELGESIGVTRQVITRIETGTQNVTLQTLQTLVLALNCEFLIELKQKKRSRKST